MTTTKQREEVVPPVSRKRKLMKRTLITTGLLIGLLIVGVTGYWALARTGAVDSPTITQVVPPRTDFASGTTTAVAPGASQGLADGCLGGPGTDPAAQVLAAQQEATITPEGAAGFALAFLRFGGTAPGNLQLDTVLPQIVHPSWLSTALPAMTAHTAELATVGGTHGSVANAPDAWRIVAADPSAASISVGFVAYLGQQGAPKQAQLMGTLILDAVGSHWVVAGTTPAPADPLAPIQGAPWHSYAGVC